MSSFWPRITRIEIRILYLCYPRLIRSGYGMDGLPEPPFIIASRSSIDL